MQNLYLGIDPGESGSLVFVTRDQLPITQIPLNLEPQALIDRATPYLKRTITGVRERVGYIAGDGGKGSFTFGRSAGKLDILLSLPGISQHIDLKLVTPTAWRTRLSIPTVARGGTKAYLKKYADKLLHNLHPDSDFKITLRNSDAFLLATLATSL